MDNIIKKKRGRKPKIAQDTQDIKNKEILIPILNLKKRGRKPKNTVVKTINNNIDINTEIEISFEDNLKTNIEISPINNIWLKKYQPKTVNEIIGNKDQINIIRKWLLNYKQEKFNALIISGAHGIGKNLIITLILNELGYEIKYICNTHLKNKNIINETIQSYNKSKKLYNISSNYNNKYAIIIDDTESITLSSEKDNLLELFKLNEQHKYFPLIFISNLQHSKLINNLKKLSLDIYINPPSVIQIKNYIKMICTKELMIIDNDDIYTQIIKFCQLDIRKLLYVLQDLYYTYNNKNITMDMFKEYQNMTQKKDIDVGLYIATKSLLDNYKNINKCLQLYETEKVLLPLTIYENYYKKIFKQQCLPKDTLNTMVAISDSISFGDVIETNIYSDQNWFLQNIHGFYTCVNTSYNINMIKTKKIDYDLVFSADLNKTSSKNINKKKNIANTQSKFKLKNINTSIIRILKNSYNLDNKNIQVILKIDKTNIKNKDEEPILDEHL